MGINKLILLIVILLVVQTGAASAMPTRRT